MAVRIALVRRLGARICVLRLLRIADLQVVVDLGHARHLADNRLRQLLRGSVETVPASVTSLWIVAAVIRSFFSA